MNTRPLVQPADDVECQLLTIERTRELLSIGRSNLYNRIAAGEIKTVKIGHRTLISRKSLSEFLAKIGA